MIGVVMTEAYPGGTIVLPAEIKGWIVLEHLIENSRVVCLCCPSSSNSILANMDEFGNLPLAASR
jgi:hypothetical protein